jgi:hypothetical protein
MFRFGRSSFQMFWFLVFAAVGASIGNCLEGKKKKKLSECQFMASTVHLIYTVLFILCYLDVLLDCGGILSKMSFILFHSFMIGIVAGYVL